MVSLLIVLLGLCAPPVEAQTETTIQLEGQPADVVDALQENATAVVSEFNRAFQANHPPKLAGVIATDAGRESILDAWREESFYCPQTELTLVPERQEEGTYELRSIPLVVEGGEHREAILRFNADGKLRGFTFAGTLVVHTVPSGATVENVPRSRSASAPARFESLPVGEHQFTIREEGYRTKDTTLVLTAGTPQRDTVHLEPGYGYVQIEGAPDRPSVQIDGRERSLREDGSVRLRAAQQHTLTISKRYYQSREITVAVETDQTKVVEAPLERKRVPFLVESDPSEASVTVTGKALESEVTGTAPLQRQLEAGRTYTVRVSKVGHVPRVQTIATDTDTTIQRTITLSPIQAESNSAEVEIGNVEATRSEETIIITYDLLRTYDDENTGTYEVSLSIAEQDGADHELKGLHGAIGNGVVPGINRKIELRPPIPEGSSIRLMVEDPSRAFSLTAGQRPGRVGNGLQAGNSTFEYRTSTLTTFSLSSNNGLLSLGIGQGDIAVDAEVGGNAFLAERLGAVPLAIYIPLKPGGSYQQRELVLENRNGLGFEYLNIGFGAGIGGRLQFADARQTEGIPVIGNLIVEGSLLYRPGYFHTFDEPSSMSSATREEKPLGRTQRTNLEFRFVDLVNAGGGRKLGITVGFVSQATKRASAGNIGDYLSKALTGSLESVSEQQLFRVGINIR